jgi:7-cyano-7-deazaguanine synthase
MARTLTLGLAHTLDVEAPYAGIGKAEVVRRGLALGVPFEFTMSCMKPVVDGARVRHCGECSKCRERHDAFVEVGVADPTEYESVKFTAR